jgi:hypothetical protein
MRPNYFGKSAKIKRSNPHWQKKVSTKWSETGRYSATGFGRQLGDYATMPKAKKMPIQNVLIAIMMISAFSRQEMITGKSPSTLGHKATNDAMSTSHT